MMKLIFPTLPREFGIKRSVIRDWDTLFHLINKWNGKIDLYLSVYEYNEQDPNKVFIDKIYLDLDSPSCWEKTKQAHLKLMEKNLEHYIQFTGGGFGIFIFVDVQPLDYPKTTLELTHRWIASELKLTIGKPEKEDIDEHIVGDIRRITRIPNTFNAKPNRRRFCVPLIEEDFTKSFNEIKEIAKTQRFVEKEKCIFGESKLNIKEFDVVPDIGEIEYLNKEFDLKEVNADLKFLEGRLPQLIIRLLSDHQCGFKDRYYTILAFREAGFPLPLCIEYCKQYWFEHKFIHSLRDERQFQYIYGRSNLYFPQWEFLQKHGYKITEEDKNFSFYKRR